MKNSRSPSMGSASRTLEGRCGAPGTKILDLFLDALDTASRDALRVHAVSNRINGGRELGPGLFDLLLDLCWIGHDRCAPSVKACWITAHIKADNPRRQEINTKLRRTS